MADIFQVAAAAGDEFPEVASPREGYALFLKFTQDAAGDAGLYVCLAEGVWSLMNRSNRSFVPVATLQPEGSTKLVNLSTLADGRLQGRVKNPGVAGAKCYIEYSANGGTTWAKLLTTDLACDATGNVQTPFEAIPAAAKVGDILIRLTCTHPQALPEFRYLNLQVR